MSVRVCDVAAGGERSATLGGSVCTLVHDAENRLQQVKQGSTVLASYTLRQAQGGPDDADGNRVTAVMGSSTTVYVGAYYEKTTSGSSTTITKYYQAGGQRVALRVNGVVRWLATDHPSTKLRTGLGSTSVTASENGTPDAELRYKPWGESRGIPSGATPTQRRFTGQVLDEVAGGLYFYNARYYDPALARFAQADTIVPNPLNPQNLNRYTYALGNPLRRSDPSGHFSEEQLITWFGEEWHSLFSEAWQAILLEAELGDVLTSGVDDVTMFVLNELGGLAGWYIPNAGLSSAIGISEWVNKTDAASSALYRPIYADAGPTHGYAGAGLWLEFQLGNNLYQRIGGRYSAAATLTLPAEWYRGQSQHVQLHSYFAGFELGLGDIADLGLESFAVGMAAWGARQAGVKAIAAVGLTAVGGVAGVAILAVNLAEWVTFDTSYSIAFGQGTPLPRPVPEPPHRRPEVR